MHVVHVTYERVIFHMEESHLIWTSHVTYEWGLSHINEEYPTSMRHVEGVIFHMEESCHIWIGHAIYEFNFCTYDTVLTLTDDAAIVWVMSHTNVIHERIMSHIKESCPIWRSHVPYEGVVTHMNRSFHIWMRHVTCGTVLKLNDDAGIESTIATLKVDINFFKVYEWVALQLSHVWMSHVYEWDWIYNDHAQNRHQLCEGTWMSCDEYVTNMKESRYAWVTYEWVTYMNEIGYTIARHQLS